MRRWLAIFLLVLLPFQFSWAAVANYCAHESGPSAHHVGHHAHAAHGQDGAAADAGDQGDKSDENSSEAPAAAQDCGHGHCHGHCVGMFELPRAFTALAPGDAPPAGYNTARTEPPLAQPERPQWAPLA